MSTLKHKGKGPQALTGNELRDGIVVWLSKEFEWTRNYAEALKTEDPEQIEAMRKIGERDEADNIVVGVYFVDTDPETGDPVRYREKFRVSGPTNDLSKTAREA